jgi:hypothetical protein
MYACTSPDDAILKWNLAKRKMTVQKYGAPGGSTSAHAALLSNVPADDAPADDTDSLPTLEDCADDYDDHPSPKVVTYHSYGSLIPPARLTSPRSEMTP